MVILLIFKQITITGVHHAIKQTIRTQYKAQKQRKKTFEEKIHFTCFNRKESIFLQCEKAKVSA